MVDDQPNSWTSGLIDVNEYGNASLPYDEILNDLLTKQTDEIHTAINEVLYYVCYVQAMYKVKNHQSNNIQNLQLVLSL